MKKRNFGYLPLVTLFVAVLMNGALAAEYNLFAPETRAAQTTVDTRALPSYAAPALSARTVALNPVLVQPKTLRPGDTIDIPIGEGKGYRAVVYRVSTDINGSVSVLADIEGSDLGKLVVSNNGSAWFGSVSVPETNTFHQIVTTPNKMQVLTEVNQAVPTGVPCAAEDSVSASLPEVASWDGPERTNFAPNGPLDPATIEIMIVYTPAAFAYMGDTASMNAWIAQCMGESQTVHDNSETIINLSLVYSGEIAYVEDTTGGGGSMLVDLEALTAIDDGQMDGVHALRDTYGADLVCLWTNDYGADNGGIAWTPQHDSPYPYIGPESGFSVVFVAQSAGPSYSSVHEWAHNGGCGHHAQQASREGPALFDYSAGWRWLDAGNYLCSVMTYTGNDQFGDNEYSIRVPHFSNPSVPYNGIATGDAAVGDNARTLRETKEVLEAFGAPTGDTYETNDSSAQATTITPDETQAHSIRPAGDVDWLVFTLENRSDVTIETDGALGDTQMTLYESDATTQVEFDDDSGNGFFSYIDRLVADTDSLPAGTYYVKINAFDNAALIGSYDVTLTALTVVPDLVIYSHMINDDNIGESSGNDNGQIDSGETVELSITLRNVGTRNATNTSATISSSSGYVSFSENTTSTYGTITPGSTALNADDFEMDISAAAPAGTAVVLDLAISSTEGAWNDSITVYVSGRPSQANHWIEYR